MYFSVNAVKTMQVSEVMTRRVISVSPDESIDAAIELMWKHHISGVPVVDDNGRPVGLVTEGDFPHRPETGTAATLTLARCVFRSRRDSQ